MMSIRLLSVYLIFALAFASAQSGTEGSILGTVKDSSGAVLPNARVQITNIETGIASEALTDGNGYFQILALPRGLYRVTISAPHFSTWELTKIELTVGEQQRIAPVLSPGDVKQQVTVEASAEIVQTERASLEVAIQQKQIRDLPINGRDPIQLVVLTPGMRYLGVNNANVQSRAVQGNGQHSDATQFSVDGISANDPSAEGGMALPNLDSVQEFRIETNSFSAENGRDPLQVLMVTKGGTNQFHGTAWEFLRNDFFDASDPFLHRTARVRRNQYGGTVGGPVFKNKTFFFASYEGLKIHNQGAYNSVTISPQWLNGDFSNVAGNIIDPQTGQSFPNKQIPTNRFSSASKFFFPNLLLPNSPGNRFQALAANPDDNSNFVLRIDHQVNSKQKFYGRWIRVGDSQTNTGYMPEIINTQDLLQNNAALNYDYTIKPWLLWTFSGGIVHSRIFGDSPNVGQENLTEKAGIQGFPSALRENAIGLPTVAITGFTGFGLPTQVPSSFKREVLNFRSSVSIVRGRHTIAIGGEYLDNRTYNYHASTNPRGNFTFNGQYTGQAFADYLLGLTSAASQNAVLAEFGIQHSPYSALYIDETWRVHHNLTINVGLRWDYWWEKAFVRGGGTTFDFSRGVAVAGETSDHQVDLTAQPIAPFFAAATKGLWITATQAGMPPGLFQASGKLAPRVGLAWRPTGDDSLVIRAGWGIFAASFYGNATGSSIIGPPYFATQNITFAKASNQRWETAFPADPSNFVAPSIASAVYGIKPMDVRQFNVSLQKTVPRIDSAVTISYVGSRGRDLTDFNRSNTAPPGIYANQAALTAAMPYPRFGTINVYESFGRDWYNALQTKFEKRFSKGITYMFSYAFSRDIAMYGAESTNAPTLYAPKNYDRGPSPNERRHILTASGVWEIPIGRGRWIGSNMNKVVNAVVGGWQLSGIYRFNSGDPLTITSGTGLLGNGVSVRANIVGDPHIDHPSTSAWFNKAAFAAPAAGKFGTSGVGLISGPALHVLDTGLMKNFHFSEQRYLQFRWEMFNAMNEVNLNDPIVLTTNAATFGSITGASPMRQMQLGLKFVF